MNALQGLIIVAAVVVPILVLVGWLVAIQLLINAGKQKGHFKDGGEGVLWFVGIFATPIVVGLYILALPDKRADVAPSPQPQMTAAPQSDELPDL